MMKKPKNSEYKNKLAALSKVLAAGVSSSEDMLPSTKAELLQWLDILINASAGQAIYDLACRYVNSSRWSQDALIRSTLMLLQLDAQERALELLIRAELSADERVGLLSVAQQLLQAGAIPLLTAWLCLLEQRWVDDMQASMMLASLDYEAGQYASVVSRLEPRLELLPEHYQARLCLALSLFNMGRLKDAMFHLPKLLDQRPRDVNLLSNLLGLLEQLGLWAIGLRIIRKSPENIRREPVIRLRQAQMLRRGRLFDASLTLLSSLSRSNYDPLTIIGERGCCYYDANRFYEAEAEFSRILAQKPNHAVAGLYRAMSRFHLGDYPGAWHDYEHRLALGVGFHNGSAELHGIPVWDGSATGTLVVHAEQGLGDVVQMLRYLPLISQRSSTLVLDINPLLLPLLNSLATESKDFELEAHSNEKKGGAPDSSRYRLPLMSAPTVLGEPFPTGHAYLNVSPSLKSKAAELLRGENGVRIGVVWAGNPNQSLDYQRSLHLTELSRLFDIQGADFYLLQKDESAAQADWLIKRDHVYDIANSIGDISDLAGVLTNLDLLVSICSMPAHLAGALGVPVWTLSKFNPYWVWGAQGSTTPWYHSMRLFRQNAPGDWKQVVSDVRSALFLQFPSIRDVKPLTLESLSSADELKIRLDQLREVISEERLMEFSSWLADTGMTSMCANELQSWDVGLPRSLLEALISESLGDIELAKQGFEKILELDPRMTSARLGLVRVLRAQRLITDAWLNLSLALRYDEGSVGAKAMLLTLCKDDGLTEELDLLQGAYANAVSSI